MSNKYIKIKLIKSYIRVNKNYKILLIKLNFKNNILNIKKFNIKFFNIIKNFYFFFKIFI